MTGPTHYNAFEADLKNRTGKFTKSRSSVKGLLDYLQRTKDNPRSFDSVDAAKAYCANPNDKRLAKYMPAIRALVNVWGTGNAYQAEVVRVAAPRGGDKYLKHAAAWNDLTVTDIPTGEHGKYNLVQGFSDVDKVKGSAIAWTTVTTRCNAKEVESQPHYWMKLGSMASKPQRSGDRKRYVRCFSCAAIAAYTLVKDHDFDDVDIAVVGAPDYDHYFVVVGDLDRIKHNTFGGAKAVDLWQHNLDKKFNAVNDLEGFAYASSGFTIFCEFPSDQRRAHASIV